MIYFAAAFFEILGCFSFWAYFRLGKSALFLGLGGASLAAFAVALTRVNLDFAGRAYAVYGGICIVSSLLWLHFVEKQAFTKWDLIGGAICLLGACVVLYGGRGLNLS
nr:YnfA family protein [uncultured Campylobacter sp.]